MGRSLLVILFRRRFKNFNKVIFMISSIFENNTAVTFHLVKRNCPQTHFIFSLVPCNKFGCDIRSSRDKTISSYFVSFGFGCVSKFFDLKSDALHCLGVRLLYFVNNGYTYTVKVD